MRFPKATRPGPPRLKSLSCPLGSWAYTGKRGFGESQEGTDLFRALKLYSQETVRRTCPSPAMHKANASYSRVFFLQLVDKKRKLKGILAPRLYSPNSIECSYLSCF